MPTPCPGCSKMASLETGDPEVESVDISDGVVTASVRLVKNSSCCSEEMKDYTFELEDDISSTLEAHMLECHATEESEEVDLSEFEADEGDCETIEEGGGRYAKAYTGVSLSVNVTCSQVGCNWSETITITDKVPNSSFEELN